MDRTALREKILAILKANGAKQYRRRELFGMMNEKGLDYRVFKALLGDMEDAGEVARTKGRKISLPQASHILTGVFTGYRNGGGRVVLPDGSRVIVRKSKVGDAMSGDTVRVQVKSSRAIGIMPAGTITGIVERSKRPIIGLFQKRGATMFIIPQDEGFPFHVLVQTGQDGGAKSGELVACRLIEPTLGFSRPLCAVTEVLGDPDAPGVDVLAIVRRYELPVAFSPETITESEALPDDLGDAVIARRRDIRDMATVTIDPVDAKDFDDAITIEPGPDGGYRLGVHIADVSHYVKPGSAMDRDALERGMSCYLVDRVIPMLPERLSNGLCSLNPRVDRLTKSVFARIGADGSLLETECANTVINSDIRLTYEQVQAFIDGADDDGVTAEIGAMLRTLAGFAAVMIDRRAARGSLDLDVPESKVVLDEKGAPVDIVRRERLFAHRMVEEAMLLANTAVAQVLGRAEAPLLYRVHDTPDMERLETFGSVAAALGYSFDARRASDPLYIQAFLVSIQGSAHTDLLNTMLLRSMKKAAYSPENIGHYGLALDEYAHFTSPIRRYPDLVVHRQLDAYVLTRERDGSDQTIEGFRELGGHTTEREIITSNAERDSIKMKTAEFMLRFLGETFDGRVSGIMPNGFFVALDTYFVEGLVHVNSLEDDYYEIDGSGISLVGQRTGRAFTVGDRVAVTVSRVNKQMGEIDFQLVKKTGKRAS